jgi:hypothetical protein
MTKDQPLGGGPSRKLNNIIGVVGCPTIELAIDVLIVIRLNSFPWD